MADARTFVKRATYEDEFINSQERWRAFVRMRYGKIVLAASSFGSGRMRLYFGPFGPTGRPDPTIIQTAPNPTTSFMAVRFAVLLAASMETPAPHWPVVVIAFLVLLPFLSGEGEKVGVGGQSLF